MRSVACDIATQVAAPTISAAIMESLRSMPCVTMINNVIPTNVMPDSGDQFVRPMASERMIPAIHIHSVPRSAIVIPRPRPIVSTEVTAITLRSITAPTIAKYSILIGISSFDRSDETPAAFCIERIALTISGNARMTPMIAPPINMPMPSGR